MQSLVSFVTKQIGYFIAFRKPYLQSIITCLFVCIIYIMLFVLHAFIHLTIKWKGSPNFFALKALFLLANYFKYVVLFCLLFLSFWSNLYGVASMICGFLLVQWLLFSFSVNQKPFCYPPDYLAYLLNNTDGNWINMLRLVCQGLSFIMLDQTNCVTVQTPIIVKRNTVPAFLTPCTENRKVG